MPKIHVFEKDNNVVRSLKFGVVYVLAFVLILTSVISLYSIYNKEYTDHEFIVELAKDVITIIMAEFILFDPKKNVLRAIGFYAFSIGISRIILSIQTLTDANEVQVLIGGTFVVLGLNILLSSYNYINGTVRGHRGMITNNSIMAVVILLMIVFSYHISKSTGTAIFNDFSTYIIQLVQCIVLLLALDTEEVRYGTSIRQSETRVESVCVTNTIDGELKISRKDALVLSHMFDDRSGWIPMNDGGPVELETSIRLIEGRVQSDMILQKWSGSDKIFFTVSNDANESIIAANRFPISYVMADGDDENMSHIRLYDDNGMRCQIEVYDPIVKKRGEDR